MRGKGKFRVAHVDLDPYQAAREEQGVATIAHTQTTIAEKDLETGMPKRLGPGSQQVPIMVPPTSGGGSHPEHRGATRVSPHCAVSQGYLRALLAHINDAAAPPGGRMPKVGCMVMFS